MSEQEFLPRGCHLAVYLPTEKCDIDAAEASYLESKAWMAESYDEAVRVIYQFVFESGEFIPEVECRFEIFNEFLLPVGDQDFFEKLMLASIEESDHKFAESLEEYSPYSSPPPAPDKKKEEEKPKEVREVRFDEIKIEDKRGS